MYTVKCTQYDISVTVYDDLMYKFPCIQKQTHTNIHTWAKHLNLFVSFIFRLRASDTHVSRILFYIVEIFFGFLCVCVQFWLKQMNQRIVLIEQKRQAWASNSSSTAHHTIALAEHSIMHTHICTLTRTKHIKYMP